MFASAATLLLLLGTASMAVADNCDTFKMTVRDSKGTSGTFDKTGAVGSPHLENTQLCGKVMVDTTGCKRDYGDAGSYVFNAVYWSEGGSKYGAAIPMVFHAGYEAWWDTPAQGTESVTVMGSTDGKNFIDGGKWKWSPSC